MRAKHWPLILSCWRCCPAEQRRPATCKHLSKTALPPPSAATQYQRGRLLLPASLAETRNAFLTSCTRRPAPRRHDVQQLQSDTPVKLNATKRWNQNNRITRWQCGPGTTGSRGCPAQGLGRSRACRGSWNSVAQWVSEGAYIGDNIWRDVEGQAAWTA